MEQRQTFNELPQNLAVYAENGSGRIQAQVSSFEHGLQIYKDINIVRVKGPDSNLFIMEDYMPIIGQINGRVDFIGKENMITLENVSGFFCHEHNVFFLLIKD